MVAAAGAAAGAAAAVLVPAAAAVAAVVVSAAAVVMSAGAAVVPAFELASRSEAFELAFDLFASARGRFGDPPETSSLLRLTVHKCTHA